MPQTLNPTQNQLNRSSLTFEILQNYQSTLEQMMLYSSMQNPTQPMSILKVSYCLVLKDIILLLY
jgi:hypothetical protein